MLTSEYEVNCKLCTSILGSSLAFVRSINESGTRPASFSLSPYVINTAYLLSDLLIDLCYNLFVELFKQRQNFIVMVVPRQRIGW